MKRFLRIGAILVAVVAAAGAALWVSVQTPYRAFPQETFLTIERGATSRGMAAKLAESGIIHYEWQFLMLRALTPSAKLQAGEYRFADVATPGQVFDRIARGDIYHFDFTVPEGSNMFDVARMLESQNILKADDFLKAASDPAAVRDIDPAAASLEGYLFPATYQLTHATTAADLCRMMTREFRHRWAQIAKGSAIPVHDVVTLASLVEKETGVSEERALVASVFTNRLKKPMRLDCDPTVIYAALLEKRYSGVIHRSDLDRKSPYNTYHSDGLPPGPIANPGARSLAAALNPAQSEFLYFVAKPEGGSHVFSATLAEHEKAVAAYRHGVHTQPDSPKPTPKTPGKAG